MLQPNCFWAVLVLKVLSLDWIPKKEIQEYGKNQVHFLFSKHTFLFSFVPDSVENSRFLSEN